MPMASSRWTFKLRLVGKKPDQMRMDRLAHYIGLFADLLGLENGPVFKGVQDASVGLKAFVPPPSRIAVGKRLLQLKSDPDSRPAKVMRLIQSSMGEDRIPKAEVRDESDSVIYVANWNRTVEQDQPRLQQHGCVDGVVTGLIGADDTLHLYFRDIHSRDLRLIVRNVDLSRALLQRFRSGSVRLKLHGYWIRTENGWSPEASKCYVDSFEVLDESPLIEIFDALNRVPGNGWAQLEDPISEWERIRGIRQ